MMICVSIFSFSFTIDSPKVIGNMKKSRTKNARVDTKPWVIDLLCPSRSMLDLSRVQSPWKTLQSSLDWPRSMYLRERIGRGFVLIMLR